MRQKKGKAEILQEKPTGRPAVRWHVKDTKEKAQQLADWAIRYRNALDSMVDGEIDDVQLQEILGSIEAQALVEYGNLRLWKEFLTVNQERNDPD